MSGLFNYSVDGDTIRDLLDLMERVRPKNMLPRINATGAFYPRPNRDEDRLRPSPMTPEKIKCMVSLAQEGLDQKEIAARIGVTQSAVSKRLCRMGYRRNAFNNRSKSTQVA